MKQAVLYTSGFAWLYLVVLMGCMADDEQTNAGDEGQSVNYYSNPILAGFNPDPSICRVGNDFYLTNSAKFDFIEIETVDKTYQEF